MADEPLPTIDTTCPPIDVVLDGSDIEIGAVEIKDGTSDQRAVVTDLPQNLSPTGTALIVSDLLLRDELIGVPSGDTDDTNPVKVGARYNLVPPTFSDADVTDLQSDVNGNLRVVLASELAGEDLTGDVLGVLSKPVASATYAPSSFTGYGAAATANIKATPGGVFAVYVSNINVAVRYFQLHNKASAASAGEVPLLSFMVPAGSATAPAILSLQMPWFASELWHSIGITFGWSTTAGTYTAATAADHNTLVRYL